MYAQCDITDVQKAIDQLLLGLGPALEPLQGLVANVPISGEMLSSGILNHNKASVWQ